jgi:hypothetical protein
MPSGQLPKSLTSSSLYDASPHTIVGSPHLRLGEFVFSDAKGLFRQHRPISDIADRSEDAASRSRVSRSTRGQPQDGAAEVVVLGEIAIDCNTVDLVVADDRLNELITAVRNVGNPAS